MVKVNQWWRASKPFTIRGLSKGNSITGYSGRLVDRDAELVRAVALNFILPFARLRFCAALERNVIAAIKIN